MILGNFDCHVEVFRYSEVTGNHVLKTPRLLKI